MVFDTLLAQHEVEGVLVFLELVVERVGHGEGEGIAREALSATFAEVRGVARGRGALSGHVGEVDVELRLEGQTFDDGGFGEEARNEFVLFVGPLVVLNPLEGGSGHRPSSFRR